MSSLWTPGGEHPVDPNTGEHQPSEEPQSASVPDLESLSPEEQSQAEALAREMATVREQLASTPAALVVANHLMGLYELAAIHLSQQPANMGEASVAIDALGAVVEALPDRLGEAEATLRDALHQIRLAYVQVGQQADDGPDETEPDND
jgi:uncharacterized protein with GYD domain